MKDQVILEKSSLINGRFDYQDQTLDGLQVSGTLAEIRRFTYPFTIAVFYGSWKVVAVLLKEGVDPLAQEEHEGNILHLLVFLTAENLKPEDNVLQIYNTLMGILSLENKRTLLHAENGIYQRPIEYAANRGTIQLLRAMFDTHGVYRVAELDTGMIKYIQYDITEYEIHGARLKKSPLYFLSMSAESTFSNKQCMEFLDWTPIKQWCKAKQRLNILPCSLWLVVRIIMIVMFHVIMLHIPASGEVSVSTETMDNPTGLTNSSAYVNISNRPFIPCHGLRQYPFSNTNRQILIYAAVAQCMLVIFVDCVDIVLLLTQRHIHRVILIGKHQE